MWRILRLIFMGYWEDKPRQRVHTCTLTPVEVINNKVTKYDGSWRTSKIYVQRCTECGRMHHYEVKP